MTRKYRPVFSFFFSSLFAALLTSAMLFTAIAHADDYEAGREAANTGKFTEAYVLWKPLADAGDERAAYSLGRMYARGDGVQANFDLARTYFERSADKGYGLALLSLGKMYYYGDGVQKNTMRSQDYFSRASAKGITEANGYLKKMKSAPPRYDSSSSVGAIEPSVPVDRQDPQDYPTAPPAPQFDSPNPSAPTGSRVMQAPVVSLPVTNALQPSAEVPSALSAPLAPPASAPLIAPVVADPGIAGAAPIAAVAAAPAQAAGTLDPLAPYHVKSAAFSANLGADGRSIRFDSVAEAVIRGLPSGNNDIANFKNSLFYGPLVTDERSLANYLAEANGGNPDSQNTMGFAALNAGDIELARSWFERSAKQQNGVALFALGNLAFDNNYAESAALFRQASDLGVVAAKRNYGYFLIKGIGLDQDQGHGRQLLEQASQQGDALATELAK